MSRGIFCLRAMYRPKFTGPALKEFGPARKPGPARTAWLTGRPARADLYLHLTQYHTQHSK